MAEEVVLMKGNEAIAHAAIRWLQAFQSMRRSAVRRS